MIDKNKGGGCQRGVGGSGWGKTGPHQLPYLRGDLLTAGLAFEAVLRLRVVKGRLGLGVGACVVMVGVLGAQVQLCKVRAHAAGLAEGLRARDHGRRSGRRRRGSSAVAALKSGQV